VHKITQASDSAENAETNSSKKVRTHHRKYLPFHSKRLEEIDLENEEEKPAIECSMSYTLLDESGKEVATGECKGTIDKEHLTVFPKFGNILPFHLRDIIEIDAENYRIISPLFSKETLILFNLGYYFEDFLRILTNLRNEVIIKDLLMNETIRKADVNMEFVYYDETGKERQKGVGKIRLYETGIVIIPQKGEVLRVPYSDIANVSEENLNIKVSTEFGEQLLLSKLGGEFDPFLKTISDIYNELQLKAVSSLKAFFPGIDSVSLRRIASIMKEGKAARRADVERINPKVWHELEKKITSTRLNESYTFLKKLSRQEKISIGFKRGLMGDLTGEYVWFLMPIYSITEKEYGNAVAMEAAGEENGGKATYFFRIVGRRDYQNYRSLEELDKEADKFIIRINRCMLDINFRREPIYLPDERLDEPAYFKYKIAIQRIPSLRLLRSLYIGRVMHTTSDQWKSDVMDLLKFNMMTHEESAKWKKTKR
jgi:hypothetical protein